MPWINNLKTFGIFMVRVPFLGHKTQGLHFFYLPNECKQILVMNQQHYFRQGLHVLLPNFFSFI
jgi:hypothetical protein